MHLKLPFKFIRQTFDLNEQLRPLTLKYVELSSMTIISLSSLGINTIITHVAVLLSAQRFLSSFNPNPYWNPCQGRRNRNKLPTTNIGIRFQEPTSIIILHFHLVVHSMTFPFQPAGPL